MEKGQEKNSEKQKPAGEPRKAYRKPELKKFNLVKKIGSSTIFV